MLQIFLHPQEGFLVVLFLVSLLPILGGIFAYFVFPKIKLAGKEILFRQFSAILKIIILIIIFNFSPHSRITQSAGQFSIFNSVVYAHPVDEIGISVYDQKQTLEISPNHAKLIIDLKFYALEKIKLWSSINTNPDQVLSQSEKDSWMKKGSEASWIEIGNKKYLFKPARVSIPDYDEFFSSKPVEIKIEYSASPKFKPGDEIYYFYQSKDQKLDSIQIEVKGIDSLKISQAELKSPDSLSFRIEEGTSNISSFSGLNSSSSLNQFLNKYIKADNISATLAITAVFVSFLIGMLHALTPGHGKAIIAGFLIGEKGTVVNAIQLGLIITLTHTLSVFILGLITLFLAQYVFHTQLIKSLGLFSGILITFFGLSLFITRLRKLLSNKSRTRKIHIHENAEHNHRHDLLTWKNLLPLGIFGGLVPCIDALAILIVAATLGKIIYGMIILLFFSAGLAAALISAGLIVIFAKNKMMKKISKLEKYEKYSSVLSSAIVTILGIALILGQNL